jgi:hypothetical protein
MRARHIHLNRRFVFALSLFVCLVVSACASAVAPSTQATPTAGVPAFAAKLQPLLVAKMKEQRTPGAIIFVDDPGQGSWTTTLGTSDLATRVSMNVNSYMRIGSITKTFTGTVILQLVDADFGGVIGHNGGLPGFQSFMGYQPQKGATIVVLTNLQTAPDGSGTADELEKVIQKELFA